MPSKCYMKYVKKAHKLQAISLWFE